MRKGARGGPKANTGSVLNTISPNADRLNNKQARYVGFFKEPKKEHAIIPTFEPAFKGVGENRHSSSVSSQNSEGAESEAPVQLNDSKDTCVISFKSTALFIGDLNLDVTEKMLKYVFGVFPSLQSVKICVDAETKRSLGYGYLNFSAAEDAKKAIEDFNYVKLFGKEVRIMPSMRNTYFRKNIGTNVFFANLPLENPNLTTRAFYETFNHYGRVLSCKLERRKNIGFVYFESDAVAKKVIEELNDTEFYGNKISCGLHFDKDVRKSPEFEKRKAKLHGLTKESLLTDDQTEVEYGEHSNGPHPNSVHVKNLPIEADNEMLLDFFSKVGPVKSIFTARSKTHKNSCWGFVTYKKGRDTQKALVALNGMLFIGKKLTITKGVRADSERNARSENSVKETAKKDSISDLLSNGYRQTLYLSNLSSICNEEFLMQLCITEKIGYKQIIIDHYDETSLTFVGQVRCNSRPDANRLFESLNNKLVGDCFVKVSWRRPLLTNSQVTVSGRKPRRGENSIYNSPDSYEERENYPPHHSKIPLRHDRYFGNNCNSASTAKDSHQCAKRQLLDVLTKEIKGAMDFISYPSASRDENLKCISEYIFDVYWRSDVESLTKFILLMNTKPQHGRILQKQVQEAISFLGFQR
ncbi:LAME_0E10682g1_1 [Lachancea meyersii CBS 8951]|uniref:LAME_0E10682g1_1 n=1 Tax=Lachancea meyersii CBS 8951 TaxID=1266667 RepID=A0A1G4JKX4_9SACH|nr:LAME_0E10682g1_1 [Lachancea meyersii CBS 8951]